ncbi:MAG: hypothetical protein KBT31_04840 [Firmicutes bacterium]|nr:hypothetical protein [Candidatus Colimorpha enterica]
MQSQFDTAKVNIYIFDTGDIMTASAMGEVGYYWISKNGVTLLNQNPGYYFVEPLGRGNIPVDYTYIKYTAGDQKVNTDQYGTYTQWGYATYYDSEPLKEEEQPYLISDDEIRNNYVEVISWLTGQSVRTKQ